MNNKMERVAEYKCDLNMKATELRLGLPGVEDVETQKAPIVRKNNKRAMEDDCGSNNKSSVSSSRETAPASKYCRQEVVGWPPVRSHRKNTLQTTSGLYVKVSMDGAPYLRKFDLKVYKGYPELLKALMDTFKFTIGEYSEREGYSGSECLPTYEDKDGDWMLVGDIPWEMFISSCKRLRIMKGSEDKGSSLGL